MLTPEAEAALLMRWSNDADRAIAAAYEVVQRLRPLHPEVAARVLVAVAFILGVPCSASIPRPAQKEPDHAAN